MTPTMTKKRLSLVQKNSGFTLIEILLVILLIAILAAIGITSFTSFQREARDSTVKANVAILRTAIAKAAALARMRCGESDNFWPAVATLNANDLTADSFTFNANPALSTNDGTTSATDTAGEPCSAVELGSMFMMDKQIVQGTTIPKNPWTHPDSDTGGDAALTGRAALITACVGTGCTSRSQVCGGGAARTAVAADSFGWCYNPTTGDIWANSSRNDRDQEYTTNNNSNEYSF